MQYYRYVANIIMILSGNGIIIRTETLLHLYDTKKLPYRRASNARVPSELLLQTLPTRNFLSMYETNTFLKNVIYGE